VYARVTLCLVGGIRAHEELGPAVVTVELRARRLRGPDGAARMTSNTGVPCVKLSHANSGSACRQGRFREGINLGTHEDEVRVERVLVGSEVNPVRVRAD